MSRIRKATVAGTKALTCIYSESGGGKTYSALLIARGLAGPGGRIILIDTENRRGELYADDPMIGGYDVLQLGEPFSPQRYIDAIDEAESAGCDVIVIDSASHEWEGIGGVLDMAVERSKSGQPTFGDWKVPKTEHKHLIAKMMRSPAHIIVCARAQYKSRQIDRKDFEKYGIRSSGNTAVIRDEYQSPIQEDRFIFEMTVHMQMSNQQPGVPIITKCPQMLLSAFEKDKPVTVDTGARMARFYNQGAPTNPDAAQIADDAKAAAGKGVDAYRRFFEKLQSHEKLDLVNSGLHEKLKSDAKETDAAKHDDQVDAFAGGDRQPIKPPSFDDMEQGGGDDDIPFDS